MYFKIHQGDILKIEKIKQHVLVVSKDFFNATGEIIGCPIYEVGKEGPLHIKISTSEIDGFVQCEKLALFDLSIRGFKKVDRVTMSDVINITDAVQSIFDYI